MAHISRKRSKKAGLPPGTPMHIGEPRDNAVTMTAFSYTPSTLKETNLS